MQGHTKKRPIEPSEAVVDISWGYDGQQQRYVVGARHVDAFRAVVELMATRPAVSVRRAGARGKAASVISEEASWRSVAAQTGHIDVHDPQSEVAMTVRAYRKAQGMSQASLAKELGCQQANVSAIEKGQRKVGSAMAKKLAKIFKVDITLFL